MNVKKLMELCDYIVTEYYNNNVQPFFDYLDENVLWLGPAYRQALHTKRAMLNAWARESPDLSFTLGDINAFPVVRSSICADIILSFPVWTEYEDGNVQMHRVRMDFGWTERKLTNEKGEIVQEPRIAKIHISNAVEIDERDFIYTTHSENVNTGQVSRTPAMRVIFRGAEGISYHVISDSIVWIENIDEGRHTMVHTQKGESMAYEKSDYFLKNYPGVFLSPHASYLVNPLHIKGFERFRLYLDNRINLPIPEKRYTAFKKEFYEWTEKWNMKRVENMG